MLEKRHACKQACTCVSWVLYFCRNPQSKVKWELVARYENLMKKELMIEIILVGNSLRQLLREQVALAAVTLIGRKPK